MYNDSMGGSTYFYSNKVTINEPKVVFESNIHLNRLEAQVAYGHNTGIKLG